jgi:hypothetical protein
MSESFLRLPTPFIEIACRSLEESGMVLCPHCHFHLFIRFCFKGPTRTPWTFNRQEDPAIGMLTVRNQQLDPCEVSSASGFG